MKPAGFTLLELMIVITLIAIISAIAIPNLLQSKKSANETAVIATLRTISAVEQMYKERFGSYATLPLLFQAALIDEYIGGGNKHGYTFATQNVTDTTWTCVATPSIVGSAGDRGFLVDVSGVIRYSPDGTQPTAASPPID